jgi:hypothetical protein
MPHDAKETPHNVQKNIAAERQLRSRRCYEGVKIPRHCVGLLAFSLGCGTVSSTPRFYNGTASVGDCFTITPDPTARTLAYKNVSYTDSGTASYTVNDAGLHAGDPTGKLAVCLNGFDKSSIQTDGSGGFLVLPRSRRAHNLYLWHEGWNFRSGYAEWSNVQ